MDEIILHNGIVIPVIHGPHDEKEAIPERSPLFRLHQLESCDQNAPTTPEKEC